MAEPKPVKIQISIDQTTGDITKAEIDRDDSGVFEDIILDTEGLMDLLRGGDTGRDILSNRTGPDPRRL